MIVISYSEDTCAISHEFSFIFLTFFCYTPRNEVVEGYTGFTMSVRL